ncbi:MAG: hypothetical protein IPK98_18320 [Chloracidobacterium sp.]|nr:hypothetical protein [Chloracidobacterium sp.]
MRFSTNNDKQEVGVDGLTKLKRARHFQKQLAKYAESQLRVTRIINKT